MNIKNIFRKGAGQVCCGVAAALMALPVLTSCEDFFDQESDDVLYADQDHLNNAVDSIYSVTGIMNKLQVIADRTILLGEVRGDLTDLTAKASNDLRELATFSVSDKNMYNSPRDYYAIINNCNYFLHYANIELKSNRNEFIFMKEYAAVKSIRAWVYLQLVINYGRVPFVTEPILTKEEGERDYPMYGIADVCQYFINDLQSIPERYNTEYPSYRNIRNTASQLFYFPLSIVRGDLNLWLGTVTQNKEAYRQAALNYYQYISERNGMNSSFPIGANILMWKPGSTTWRETIYTGDLTDGFGASSETPTEDSELITMIPGDSIRAEGYYSELRNLFNSTTDNDLKPSLTPSKGMFEISEAQKNCCVSRRSDGTFSVSYAPDDLGQHRSGDLRLNEFYSTGVGYDDATGDMVETQYIYKHMTRNVHIYRRQMIYLRMAEALNGAGYPRMAFHILSTGVNNTLKNDTIYKFYNASDSIFLSKFDFPKSDYELVRAEDLPTKTSSTFPKEHNTIGLHTRGSGWTPLNEHYTMPDDTVTTDAQARLKRQMEGVDSLILNESALEFAFEGVRYYDIMRYALRQANPGKAMADVIYNRRGKEKRGDVQAEIKGNLNDQNSWFLKWNGKIGF